MKIHLSSIEHSKFKGKIYFAYLPTSVDAENNDAKVRVWFAPESWEVSKDTREIGVMWEGIAVGLQARLLDLELARRMWDGLCLDPLCVVTKYSPFESSNAFLRRV